MYVKFQDNKVSSLMKNARNMFSDDEQILIVLTFLKSYPVSSHFIWSLYYETKWSKWNSENLHKLILLRIVCTKIPSVAEGPFVEHKTCTFRNTSSYRLPNYCDTFTKYVHRSNWTVIILVFVFLSNEKLSFVDL